MQRLRQCARLAHATPPAACRLLCAVTASPTPSLLAERLASSHDASGHIAQPRALEHEARAHWPPPPPLPASHEGFPSMLVDSFGRRHTYLRISLTERCNLRCAYCMPPEGVALTPGGRLLTTDEVVRLASLFVASGVTKIRLTGGEPTVRPDLEEVTARLGALPGLRDLAMTSNGVVLAKKLPALRAAGLTAVNISLDTLVPSKFELLTRRRGHDRVLESIDAALAAGLRGPVKVNCVVMRGVNDDELLGFVERFARRSPVNVRFIEYMPFDGNAWAAAKLVPYAEMRAVVQGAHPGMARLAGDAPEEVAKNFSLPGHDGAVSFVTSMSSHFCGGCNRLRLLADGALKTCLFGADGPSLRDALRSGADDGELAAMVGAAVWRKKAAHGGVAVDRLAASPNRAMIRIGG